jgi:signal transduction histidine kinase
MVTERERQATGQIRVTEDTLERVFFLVNHELRTPITALRMAIALLQSHAQQDTLETESLLRLAASNTERLAHVVETILDWSHIVYEPEPLFKQLCDGRQIIGDTVTSLAPLAAQQRIQIQTEVAVPLPLMVDRHYLSRAFFYVVHNAIKFSPAGSRVEVRATVLSDQSDPALARLPLPAGLVTVQDQGIGIPEAFLEQIFQPFLQVDSSDRRPYSGLGLELAICREVIHKHQGKVWAESVAGQGSTFYMALPLVGAIAP